MLFQARQLAHLRRRRRGHVRRRPVEQARGGAGQAHQQSDKCAGQLAGASGTRASESRDRVKVQMAGRIEAVREQDQRLPTQFGVQPPLAFELLE